MNYVSTHTHDNQTLRWFTPDPAMQFSNPYLGMANNPVFYTDPDGQFAWAFPIFQAVFAGAAIGGVSYTVQTAFGEGGLKNWDGGKFMESFGYGALAGGMAYGIGSLNLGQLNSAAAHGISQDMISELRGGSFQEGLAAGAFSSIVSSSLLSGSGNFGRSTGGNLAISGLSGGDDPQCGKRVFVQTHLCLLSSPKDSVKQVIALIIPRSFF